MGISFHMGDSRVVVAIPFLGIVIKFPRIHVYNMGRLMRSEFKGRSFHVGLKRNFASLFKYDVDTVWAPKRLLFKGFVDNWREWKFSQEFSHPVLARTYIFMGGVNVQAYAAPLPFQVEETYEGVMSFVRRFLPIIGNKIARDGHHFENHENFGVIDGHFVIVDYAGHKVQSILRESADDLMRDFPLT
jgi:hypothetical protein